MAVYTDLNKNDFNIILQQYDLKLVSFYKIKNGILNTNYFLDTDSGKFVLRVFEGGRAFEEENLELDFLLDLKDVVPCCVPVKTINGINYIVYKNKMMALFHFISGEPIKKIDKNILSQIGRYIGKMHYYSRGKKLNRSSRIDMDFYYRNIDFNKLDIDPEDKRKIIDTYEEIKDVDYSFCAQGIIHNDIFPDNVFVSDGKIVGILDFNESQTGPLIFDLAIVINYWIKINSFPKEMETDLIITFLRNYHLENIFLSQEELDILPKAILKMAVTFILLRLYKFNVENNKDFLLEDKNYKQLMPLLER